MSERPPDGVGFNSSTVVTWAIMVLGMGITYGTLYGTLRGSVDSLNEINSRQDEFVRAATELLTTLQLQNVQNTADLRQIRERLVQMQGQTDENRGETRKVDENLQQQINDLRTTLAEHDRNVSDLRTLLSEMRVRDRASRSRSPPVDTYFDDLPPALHSR